MNQDTTNPLHAGPSRRRGLYGIVGATLLASVAFGAATTKADGDEVSSTFVPITPCRLIDTRPAPDNVGSRAKPLGEGDTYVAQVTGANGNCEIDHDATAIAINATAVNATKPSWMAFAPAGVDLPLSSNLNYVPGQAPTPNKVDVALSHDGKVQIYNKFGTVDVVVDVTGYYTDETLKSLLNRVAGLEARPTAFAQAASATAPRIVGGDPVVAVASQLKAPSDGAVVVQSSALIGTTIPGVTARCSLTTGSNVESAWLQIWTAPDHPLPAKQHTLSGVRTFPVAAGDSLTVRLVCEHAGSGTQFGLSNAHLSVQFLPGFTSTGG